jgi:hypothetical protein
MELARSVRRRIIGSDKSPLIADDRLSSRSHQRMDSRVPTSTSCFTIISRLGAQIKRGASLVTRASGKSGVLCAHALFRKLPAAKTRTSMISSAYEVRGMVRRRPWRVIVISSGDGQRGPLPSPCSHCPRAAGCNPQHLPYKEDLDCVDHTVSPNSTRITTSPDMQLSFASIYCAAILVAGLPFVHADGPRPECVGASMLFTCRPPELTSLPCTETYRTTFVHGHPCL